MPGFLRSFLGGSVGVWTRRVRTGRHRTGIGSGFALLRTWKELQTGRANHESSGFFPFSSLTREIIFLKIVV